MSAEHSSSGQGTLNANVFDTARNIQNSSEMNLHHFHQMFAIFLFDWEVAGTVHVVLKRLFRRDPREGGLHSADSQRALCRKCYQAQNTCDRNLVGSINRTEQFTH